MNTVDQLGQILSSDRFSDFWQRDDCPSCCVTGGIRLQMTGEPGGCGWKVTWTDRLETESEETFVRWQDAKQNLREHLTRELQHLAYGASPPAESDMS